MHTGTLKKIRIYRDRLPIIISYQYERIRKIVWMSALQTQTKGFSGRRYLTQLATSSPENTI
ncbi:MAG: hypothetical protein CL920_05905 [Deltaproteobacteria bacterium]|nr:hypothetical protein [Deltaproteobacteria bacterium]MBU48212.1 hypothetical protein [Deltaproteobacteria bacterium]